MQVDLSGGQGFVPEDLGNCLLAYRFAIGQDTGHKMPEFVIMNRRINARSFADPVQHFSAVLESTPGFFVQEYPLSMLLVLV